MANALDRLKVCISGCTRCPRLVAFRETVPIRQTGDPKPPWRRPVAGYGDPNAWLLILGLAPSASGGNRTGRIFTGDASAKFLMSALHRAHFANQPTSIAADDGLVLHECYMTAVVKCVPPDNKPLRQEVITCNSYLQEELQILKNITHILALGRIAFDTYRQGVSLKATFAHGARYQIPNGPVLYGCYHPSPQNTNTGVLTAAMMDQVLQEIRASAS